MTDFTVLSGGDRAERDLRMVRTSQKISGPWRTLAGARRLARIRSCVRTARKHRVNPPAALRGLFPGRPWMLPTAG
ncbi:hypothetical protein [Streptomyces hygroscopicus]|uniref:hypothetical protein n=1 Tax=Streptomyces hygroscopicus TaxID=1912 RepID=UPI0004C7CB39|nr:hypothetical protein [Streptomyces hygroscopicus]